MATPEASTAQQIVDAVGGAGNIAGLTHCATRLRFQLNDSSVVSNDAVEAVPGVMGAVPQAGNRYQVVIGGTVNTTFQEIMALPSMATMGTESDADVKAAARSKGPRGKLSWLDGFFEFLSDSFRPIIGALLGASIFITFMALMGTLGVIGNWADPRVELPPTWQFMNLTWRCVFYFLPLMVAYNATKKVGADPWVGFAIMGVLMLPGFATLGTNDAAQQLTVAGSEITVVHIFGNLPLTIFDYGSQVFPPLLMAAVIGPLNKLLRKVIPDGVQLIFVPFVLMLVMIPLTAFIIGPTGVYVGAWIAKGLAAVNSFSPLIFAILVPLAYPFMVPLGLHWPINAIMLLNIQNLGYDFIQGPMGAWNFACFGTTAGVLYLAVRDKNATMRQTATGALFAGLVGGISEPSLYGIHLRYKNIYKRMLPGCFVGGLIIGLGGGVTTKAFVFTSLLTIPAFDNIPLYAAGVGAAFLTAMLLVIFLDYRSPEEKAAARAGAGLVEAEPEETAADLALERARRAESSTPAPAGAAVATAPAATATATRPTAKPAMAPGVVTLIGSPMEGEVVALADVPDPVFAGGVLGPGIAIDPTGDTVHAPAAGKVVVAHATGHAFGLDLDSGVQILIHIGIDTVQMEGRGFQVHVQRGDVVEAGQPLVTFDRALIEKEGYSPITPVLVTNAKKFGSVTPAATGHVAAGDVLLEVTAKP